MIYSLGLRDARPMIRDVEGRWDGLRFRYSYARSGSTQMYLFLALSSVVKHGDGEGLPGRVGSRRI